MPEYMIKAIGFGITKEDDELIRRMLANTLRIIPTNPEIIDSQCYQPTITERKDGKVEIILAYGARALKQVVVHNPQINEAQIIKLPDVRQLAKGQASNKPARQEATQILSELKKRMEEGSVSLPTTIPPKPGEVIKTHSVENSEFPCSVKITMQDGKQLTIASASEADALPEEMKSFLQLLGKLPCKEVDIEFVKSNRGDDGTGVSS
jgi:hypothetical protein